MNAIVLFDENPVEAIEHAEPGRQLTTPVKTENDRSPDEIALSRDIVHQHMPELLPHIKEMYELGLISGWRDVYAEQTDEANPNPNA